MNFPEPLRNSDILTDARLFSSRYELIKHLNTRLHKGKIAEVGVAFGDFTKFLIDELQPSRFAAYDIFTLTDSDQMNGMSCAQVFKGRTHINFYRERFKEHIVSGVLTTIPGDSSARLSEATIKYDMIYIDGDHSYDGVRRDSEAAANCLEKNGILIFNDYTMMDPYVKYPYGVVRVVNDLCVKQNWKVCAFAFDQSMFCDIALVRGQAQLEA